MVPDPDAPLVGRYLPRKETPSILWAGKSLKRGNQELKVRVLQYAKGEAILDIREFVSSEEYNGFTKKGLAINLQQCQDLLAQLPSAISILEDL